MDGDAACGLFYLLAIRCTMDFDVVIVGAGVVGLACAAESAVHGYSVLLVEQHDSFGQETSSRNSEVIHSGIYYSPGSWKARLCVRGNQTMYEECEQFGVWYRRCGKLIVAVAEDEEAELQRLCGRGKENGVEGLELLTKEQVRQIESNIYCRAALLVPSTGIVDSHELMKAYAAEATRNGATIAYNTGFTNGTINSSGYTVRLREAAGEETEITTRMVVNAAGLYADRVAASFGIDVDLAGYRLYPNRGHYFRVSATKSKLVSRLVYPIPPTHKEGLGIHVTIDRAGQCKLGPDTEYISSTVSRDEWYRFDESRKEKFFQAASRYFPALAVDDLSPDQVGVRPKLQQPGGSMRDFIIQEETARSLPGLINLIGIESPGLTCARVIARETVCLMKDIPGHGG